MPDFVKMWVALSEMKKEKELNRLLGPRKYKTVKLPENEWHTCPRCNGTRFFEESGDLHRSAGIVPCINYYCEGGVVKKKEVEVKRRVRVKAGSRKI